MCGPVLEYDHGARVIVILHIDHLKPDDKGILIKKHVVQVFMLTHFLLVLWINDVVECSFLAIDQSSLYSDGLTVLQRIELAVLLLDITI